MRFLLRILLVNLAILVLALGYWFLVDYLYAENFELYHPYEWLMRLSFLLFALISFDVTFKALAGKTGGMRIILSLFVTLVMAVIFLQLIDYYGVDFHIWVGELLYP